MMSLSKILFLSFVVSAWTAPVTMDIDASSESMKLPESTPLNDIKINNQKVDVIWPSKPIAEILDHRGAHTIQQIADNSYQKLLAKFRRVNGSQNVNHKSNNDIIWNILQNYIKHSFLNKNPSAPSLAAQIDPRPVVLTDLVNGYQSPSLINQSSNSPSAWKALKDLLNNFTNNNQNKHDGNRMAREVIKNIQNLVSPQMIQGFTNQDSVEGTTATPELSNKSSEFDENQSGSTMTTSATEELLTTTALPTEFESTTTTTFETTTEILTTKSNEKEIISSTTQSELLDKNAEIDEAVAFNIDGGDISSTQESATQFSTINKNNFYVIYGRPTLTKKDNSLLLNANVGMAVALNDLDINDLKIINVA